MPQAEVDELVALLDLEPIEVNIFRGVSPDEDRQRVFGGQVAGQALVAAARTVEPDHGSVNSLHAYFLRPGDPTIPILYEVDRIRDGRSFTTRRVVAIQHGRAIFNMSASFHRHEPGLDHQLPMPDVPTADELPTFRERWEPWKDDLGPWFDRPRPIDTRHVDWSPPDRKEPLPPYQRVWFARRRRPARRSAAAHVRADVRVRHDAARHHAAAARRSSRRRATDDGEPRPRDVVPPPVPSRRVAALRPGHAVDVRRPWPRPRAHLHRTTATSSRRSRRKVSSESFREPA